MANRVKPILPVVISESQSAFFPGRSIIDNAMTAFEIFHSMKLKNKGKKGVMGMKLDMSKAYDRVEWGFLEAVMLKMGFCRAWVDLVMRCVKTVSYFVLVNGSPSTAFMPGRGLRQGDPLSPYLFLMCAEAFSALLRRAEQENKIHGIQVAPGAPAVSHLFFADDTILFCRANRTEAAEVGKVIKEYEEASGQRINLEKTEITVSANISVEMRNELSDMLGVKGVDHHAKYLGLPTIIGRSKKQIFAGTMERMIKKMKDWKEKSLSQAGKEVLIKSVIQAIPSYVMNCFLLPLTWCQEVEQATSRFFWGSTIENRKCHWAGWDILTSSKADGGLGFRELHYFNIAMLAKQFWALLQNTDSLIHRILKSKYSRRCDLMQAPLGYRPSFLWRSLLASRDIVGEGMGWKVGNGRGISIFSDRWVGVNNVQKPTTTGNEDHELNMVNELIDENLGIWRSNLVENTFNEEVAERILAMPLSARGEEDRRIWRYTKDGRFTVRTAYHAAVERYSRIRLNHSSPSVIPKSWKKMWAIRTLPRIKIFMWKASTNSLPTRTNLYRRHCLSDAICGLCGEEPETIDHVLLHCMKVTPIWYVSPLRLEINRSKEITFKELLWSSIEKHSLDISSLIAFTAWEIWNARNKTYFENKAFEILSIIQRAQQGFREYTDSCDVETTTGKVAKQVKKWEKPPAGKSKCNCDVAVRTNGVIGMGFVVRDSEGVVQMAGKKEMKAEGGTTLLEGLAMRYALQEIKQYHLPVAMIESDNLQLVEVINGRARPEVYLDTIVQDIKSLTNDTGDPVVRYIPRLANKVAHHIAQGPVFLSMNYTPQHVRTFLDMDVIA